ncbi:MAG: phosphate acyltransferase PlsX [Alphaproteobacteria bacterium]|nr:phosphate acyltransferase PlsX [Alphaproteobacteria bacterium]MBU1513659.1 phosphate acyltransferase PlsX [Alphaproteobacteria bacterium]MBU2094696.1 phosphate acyltransferase PlsX [Alphaproteobacteria bacterium]MBU2150235.1 phosphate acyltransferase PlsX [Alphaproteobacteria bacterium]MBU2309236.1 phosphate acyltransferase PlsX [Alphaproteobacteria bacterium]
MTQSLVISIDAMGGDHGPSVVIPACDIALKDLPPGTRLLLHGDETAIRAEMARHPALAARVEVRHAERVIAMDEKPAQALRRGKGTSMWHAVEAIREGQAGVTVSAGNTGALMAISKLILRMSADLDRPALVTSIPNATGVTTFLDVGANVDCDAARLVEFAIMGEAYHRAAHGVARPTVGLLNVGSEEMKGHEEVREANRILRLGTIDLDYKGFVEGDDITAGTVQVVVTDGFTGNVALKAMEGAARFMYSELREALTSGPMSNLGALLARPSLRRFRDKMSPSPAAPLLGLNGLVLKCHGGADARDFAKAIRSAADVAQSGFASEIERNMRRLPAALAPANPAPADGAA